MAPTKKQRQIFEALIFLMEKGEMPTVREVGALVGLRSPATVMKHLRALEREGLVSLSGKSRGIRACAFPPHSPQGDGAFPPRSPQGDGGLARGIPLVGRIAAGRPIEAIPIHEGYLEGAGGGDAFPQISIDPGVFAASGDLMALQVSGDSMIGAGILDGDHVIIRRQPVVEDGEIAAVEVGGEVTLKRWRASGPETGEEPAVRLLPENQGFAPLEITAADHKEVRVLGKYVGLVRGELRIF